MREATGANLERFGKTALKKVVSAPARQSRNYSAAATPPPSASRTRRGMR